MNIIIALLILDIFELIIILIVALILGRMKEKLKNLLEILLEQNFLKDIELGGEQGINVIFGDGSKYVFKNGLFKKVRK